MRKRPIMLARGHLDPTNPFERPLGPGAAAGWSAAFLFILYLSIDTLTWFRQGAAFDLLNNALLYTASGLLIIFFVGLVHAPSRPLRRILAWGGVPWTGVLIAALLGACVFFPLAAFESLMTRRFLTEEMAATIHRELAAQAQRGRIAGTIALSLCPAIIDELLFRGAFATGVRQEQGRLTAALSTAVGFALVSAANDLRYFPMFLLMGLVFGHARLATGSVIPALAAHLAYRAAEFGWMYRHHRSIDPLVTGPSAQALLSRPMVPWIVVATIAAVALAVLLERMGRDWSIEVDSP